MRVAGNKEGEGEGIKGDGNSKEEGKGGKAMAMVAWVMSR